MCKIALFSPTNVGRMKRVAFFPFIYKVPAERVGTWCERGNLVWGHVILTDYEKLESQHVYGPWSTNSTIKNESTRRQKCHHFLIKLNARWVAADTRKSKFFFSLSC